MHAATAWTSTTGAPVPIVGRAAERVLLQEQLAQADAGNGQLVILGGEAGIGKTTLARDLTASAEARGARVLTGHCYDLTATPPFGPWRDLAADYRPTEGDPAAPAVLAGPWPAGVPSQAELFRLVREFLDALASSRLTVAVLEDAHWSDPASLELLRHIGSHLAGRRLLILVTYRVDELTRQHPFYQQLPALVRETGGLRFNLQPLTRPDLGQLIDQTFALVAPVREDLAAYLDQHSEGNPFFAVELLQALIDEGRLRRIDGRWQMEATGGIVVSALLRQVIEARLVRLGDETRGPLQIAAVIGQEFPFTLWAEVSGAGERALLEIIERAIESRVFSAQPDGTHIRFVHALTRAAIFESILPPRRVALHRRVGETLLARGEPDPDVVAYHFTQARDERALKWLIEAGERAQRAWAWRTAFERFAAAAELLDGVAGEELIRARLLYRCGRLLRYSDAKNGIVCLTEALRLARLVDDRVLAAHVIYSAGLLRCFADDWPRGIAEMTAGIDALEAEPAAAEASTWTLVNWMADALPITDVPAASGDGAGTRHFPSAGRGTLPWFLATVGQLSAAETTAQGFMSLVDRIKPGPLVISASGHCAQGLAIAHAALGEVEHARSDLDRARRHYQQVEHHVALAATWLVELRDVLIPFRTTDVNARVRAAASARDELERGGGALLSAALARRAELALCVLDGRWTRAREIVASYPDSGNFVLRREVVATLAPIAWWQGHPEEAWGYVREWLPAGPVTPPGTVVLQDGLLLQRLAAAMSLAAGDIDETYAWLEANNGWLKWSGSVRGRAEYLTLRARLALAVGQVARARAQINAALVAARSPVQPLALCRARRIAGVVAMREGSPQDAWRELAEAVMLADACGAAALRVHARISFARFLLEYGEVEEARAALGVAAAEATRMGAGPATRQIAPMLELFDVGNDEADDLALTAREREVLALVAQGLTDAEVAARLFISPRTVSQHLRSIYAKLNVSSRSGATRYAVQHHLG